MVGQGLSQRRACQIVGLHRSTLHYCNGPDRNQDLRRQLHQFAQKRRRWGYRKAWDRLRRTGQKVNIKSPADAVRHGIAYLSEDRKRYGLTLGMDVETNIREHGG